MSRGEVSARIAREGRHRLDDLLWRRARPRWERRWEPPRGRLLRGAAPESPRGIVTASRAEGLLQRDPGGSAAIVAAAARVLDGRFRYFGLPEQRLPCPVDFARDPFSGRRWPDRHAKRLTTGTTPPAIPSGSGS